MSEPSRAAERTAAALLMHFEIREPGAPTRVDRSVLAELIDRTAHLPELLEENQCLRQLAGSRRLGAGVRDLEARLRALTARAERWIFEVVHSAPETCVSRLDIARGRSLVTALANARGALRGRRKLAERPRAERPRAVSARPRSA